MNECNMEEGEQFCNSESYERQIADLESKLAAQSRAGEELGYAFQKVSNENLLKIASQAKEIKQVRIELETSERRIKELEAENKHIVEIAGPYASSRATENPHLITLKELEKEHENFLAVHRENMALALRNVELRESLSRSRYLITRIQDGYYEFLCKEGKFERWETVGKDELDLLNKVLDSNPPSPVPILSTIETVRKALEYAVENFDLPISEYSGVEQSAIAKIKEALASLNQTFGKGE